MPEAIADLVRRSCVHLLDQLTYREREILKLRYGLSEFDVSYSIAECARIYQVTQARIRQIERKAVAKLRKMLASSHDRRCCMYTELLDEDRGF